MSLCALGCPEGCNPREAQELGGRRSFFGADGFAGGDAFGNRETIGGDTQCRVMMKAAPTSTLVVTEPQFLLQVRIAPLDAPVHVRLGHQIVQRDVVKQRRQAILEWSGSLDQQLLLGVQASLAHVPPGLSHTGGDPWSLPTVATSIPTITRLSASEANCGL